MNYNELYRSFRWQVPEHFNFATDVIDRLARQLQRTALVFVDELPKTFSGKIRRVELRQREEAKKGLVHSLIPDS